MRKNFILKVIIELVWFVICSTTILSTIFKTNFPTLIRFVIFMLICWIGNIIINYIFYKKNAGN
ncbi:hypothetical protein CFOLD11_08360 [Clostridium folliculivorans]|uniref:Uncharacterized protein n=1 Tax=Clostridium folliculivorans TaxID=2886038 RepID=A0A9W5XZX0_9CLOT|nr:hypothetical protein CFOLD11_08360 [Clostridium folliculivorans]